MGSRFAFVKCGRKSKATPATYMDCAWSVEQVIDGADGI